MGTDCEYPFAGGPLKDSAANFYNLRIIKVVQAVITVM